MATRGLPGPDGQVNCHIKLFCAVCRRVRVKGKIAAGLPKRDRREARAFLFTTPPTHEPARRQHPPVFQSPPRPARRRAGALLPQFVARTTPEPKCLHYEFTINGDVVFCREAYADAEGVLAHLENVGALLGEMLKLSDLARLEIHGPAAELEKLQGPLTQFKPE